MDPESILDLLLRALPLDPETVKFIRDVFFLILSSCKSLLCSPTILKKNKPTSREIEDIAAKLREVIAFFNSADNERDEFIDIFPEWEDNRKENIKKLLEIAESMRDSRQISSIVQIVGGSVGVVGGVAIIGSLLFPPAAPALLPAWLGGAAATALIPSFLLPAAATAVTSSLAVGGTIAAGTGGVTQVVTSITEAAILSNQIDKAKDICRQDKKNFDKMMSWFEHTQQLKSALDNLFNINILNIIFTDLKDYFGEGSLSSTAFRCALQRCFKKTLGHGLFNPSFHAAVTAVTFAVFLVRRRNRFLFQWILVGFGLVAAFNAGPQLGRLVASTVMKEGQLIPKALATKVAVGALAGIGMVLDVANIVLNSIDLAEGSKSETQEKVLEVADELQTNLDFIREVYRELRNAAKKASEDFLNSIIIDQLGKTGTVTKIAHEVYQDVLQENRKWWKISVQPRSFGQMNPSSNSLFKVIEFFNAADKELLIFRNNFGQWENKRMENISHLHLMKESLQEIRTLSNTEQFVGVNRSAAGIGAGLLQRCKRVIDTAIVTSRTAINYSNTTKLVAQLRKQMEETISICRRDRDAFIKLESWVLRMHQLNFAFDELFGEGTFDNIFMDLKEFCGGGLQNYRWSKARLQSCVRKIFERPLRLDPSFMEAVIAVVFALLLNGQRNKSYLNCLKVTQRLRFGRFRERRWTSDFTKYTDEEELALQNLEMDLVERRVTFLDTINVVLELANKDEAEISALAEELQGELDCMKEIWRQVTG